MNTFIALLRAINVGGTGKLPMSELVALCEDAGFADVKTYIQSGNVVFSAKGTEKSVKATLEKALANKMGKPFGAIIRSASELDDVLAHNPFAKEAPNRVIVLFVDEPLPKNAAQTATTTTGEQLVVRGREVYIFYEDGQGTSKLKFAPLKTGTGRNINTIQKLADMARTPATPPLKKALHKAKAT